MRNAFRHISSVLVISECGCFYRNTATADNVNKMSLWSRKKSRRKIGPLVIDLREKGLERLTGRSKSLPRTSIKKYNGKVFYMLSC